MSQVIEGQAGGEGLVTRGRALMEDGVLMLGLLLNSLGAGIVLGAPAVSCEPCWAGRSGFSLRKSGCMTLSWVVAEAYVLQSEKGQFLQYFYYFN